MKLEIFKSPTYFTFDELVYSETAIRKRIRNIPLDWKTVYNLICLAFYLDYVREKHGYPIIVNSGFRSPDLNAAVKGVPGSLHCVGLAVDLCCDSLSEFLDIRSIVGDDCRYIEYYPTRHYIHVDFRENFLRDFYRSHINKNPF